MAAVNTVLVIDDDAQFRTLMGSVLRQQGWQVFQAEGGDEGVRLAKALRPDVVLCDLLMPGGNGFQVCQSLRRSDALRDTRIIITSGKDFESDRQAALAAGADDYLTKPVSMPRLLALLSLKRNQKGGAEQPPAAAAGHSPGPLWFKFWGVRGSIPTPGPETVQYGGNTACVEVRVGKQIIILDAGTGLRRLGAELVNEFGPEPLELTLLLTHTHWDHIQGLPFFAPVYQPGYRLRILGYEGARHGLRTVLSSQMESPFFPVGFREVPANVTIEEVKEMEFQLGSVQVRAFFAYHPGICVGYRLTAHGRSLAFFPDNELRHSPRTDADSPAVDALTYARDENQKLADFVRGVDVLIMDAQYDREEYPSHIGWGHGCVDEVVELALESEVGQLFLFHHDPDHDDAQVAGMAVHARRLVATRQRKLQVDAAREGLAVELPLPAAGKPLD